MSSRIRAGALLALAYVAACNLPDSPKVQIGGYAYFLSGVDGKHLPVELARNDTTGTADSVGGGDMELPSGGLCQYRLHLTRAVPGQNPEGIERDGSIACAATLSDTPTVAIDLGQPWGTHLYHFTKIFLADRAPSEVTPP